MADDLARRPVVATRGRHLNHVARLYDPLVERCSLGRERRFRELTLAYMELEGEGLTAAGGAGPGGTTGNKRRILDVGCGTGTLTLHIARRLAPGSRVVGIDVAPRMLAIARDKAARAGLGAEFLPMAAERLEFEDQSFDTVVNSMFSHHVDTELKRLAFAEMFRVLEPGGLLVTADIHRPATVLAWLVGWASRWLLLQPELEDNLRGGLPALMAAAGFTGVRHRCQVYGLVSVFTGRRPA